MGKENIKMEDELYERSFVDKEERSIQYTVYVTAEEAEQMDADPEFAEDRLKIAIANGEAEISPNDLSIEPQTELTNRSLDEGKQASVLKWAHQATLLLLEQYRNKEAQFLAPGASHKQLWAIIACEINTNGYDVSGPQCRTKFTGLKRTYRAIKEHNKIPTNHPRSWPYLEMMDDLLGDKSYTVPQETVGISTGQIEVGVGDLPTPSSSSDEHTASSRKRKRPTLENIWEEFMDQRRAIEQEKTRRHTAIMALLSKALDTLVKRQRRE